MSNQKKQQQPRPSTKNSESPTMKVARDNLKEFESRSDEAFLARAEMERKLSSL